MGQRGKKTGHLFWDDVEVTVPAAVVRACLLVEMRIPAEGVAGGATVDRAKAGERGGIDETLRRIIRAVRAVE